MSSAVTSLPSCVTRPLAHAYVGAGHESHAVHHVGAQHHQVHRAGAVVLLAAGADRLDVADRAAFDEPLAVLLVCVGAPVGHGQANAVAAAGFEHGVGLGQGRGERLFAQHPFGASLGGLYDHLSVLADPARTYVDQVDALALEHFAVVGILAKRPRAHCRRLAPSRVGVCNRDHLDADNPVVGRIQAVAVVSPACVAYDSRTQDRCHAVPLCESHNVATPVQQYA